MPTEVPAGVFLSDRDCAVLDAALLLGLQHLTRLNGTPPQAALDAAALLHQRAAEFRANTLISPTAGTAIADSGSAGGSSPATEWLTVHDAARLTGTSTSYLRRLARTGAVRAQRTSKGGWVVDGGTLAAWAADRSHKKAG